MATSFNGFVIRKRFLAKMPVDSVRLAVQTVLMSRLWIQTLNWLWTKTRSATILKLQSACSNKSMICQFICESSAILTKSPLLRPTRSNESLIETLYTAPSYQTLFLDSPDLICASSVNSIDFVAIMSNILETTWFIFYLSIKRWLFNVTLLLRFQYIDLLGRFSGVSRRTLEGARRSKAANNLALSKEFLAVVIQSQVIFDKLSLSLCSFIGWKALVRSELGEQWTVFKQEVLEDPLIGSEWSSL